MQILLASIFRHALALMSDLFASLVDHESSSESESEHVGSPEAVSLTAAPQDDGIHVFEESMPEAILAGLDATRNSNTVSSTNGMKRKLLAFWSDSNCTGDLFMKLTPPMADNFLTRFDILKSFFMFVLFSLHFVDFV